MRAVIFGLLPFVSALPPWSWDTIQSYIHCANYSGAWNEGALERLNTASFVVFEKAHGSLAEPLFDRAEEKIVDACRQVKETAKRRQTSTDCYMYAEVDWARTFYSLGRVVERDLDSLAMHWPNQSLLEKSLR